jgi:hypothetical protein
MAKRTEETVNVEGRPYRIKDTRRTLVQRVVNKPNDVTAALVERKAPTLALAPARETRVVPQERGRARRPRGDIVFHGGRSDTSLPRSYRPVMTRMRPEQVRAEYQDRALKYAAGGAVAAIPVRAVAESRKQVRPLVDEWDKARRRMQGHVLGRLTGSPRKSTLTPQEYAQAVRRNAAVLNRLPKRVRSRWGPGIVEGLGTGNYAQHAKVAAMRGGLRLGLPLAGASAAGLQYLYDRNRKHYRIDYRPPE